MKKDNKIIFYVTILLLLILSIVLYIKLKEWQEKLDKIAEENERLENIYSVKAYQKTDSLVFEGNYTLALRQYEHALDTVSENERPQLEKRIVFLKQLQKTLKQKEIIEKDTVPLESDSEHYENLRERTTRDLDSLSFALKKAKLNIQSLKKQILEQTSGVYLSFESSKGNKIYYVGEVEDGQANGQGMALLETGSRYEGEWKDNLRHGKGSFYWLDGEYYVGDYKNDKREGFGSYYWPNGEKYVGEWRQDKRNGRGKFYNKEGKLIAEGVWKNDELVQQIKE